MRGLLILSVLAAAGGASALAAEPYSTHASNILPGSPVIANALPQPDVSSDSVGAYLNAAVQALMAGKTGAAQAALEDAETQQLDRSVPYTQGGQAITDPVAQDIYQARQALGMKDIQSALKATQAAQAALGGG